MAASLELQIREAITQYIAGRASLREFQEWFAPRTWDIDSLVQDGEVRKLINEIELLLAEFSNGHWTERELKNKLQEHSRVEQPVKDPAGVLWSDVRAPYVYGMIINTASGYQQNLGASPPSSDRRMNPRPTPA